MIKICKGLSEGRRINLSVITEVEALSGEGGKGKGLAGTDLT